MTVGTPGYDSTQPSSGFETASTQCCCPFTCVNGPATGGCHSWKTARPSTCRSNCPCDKNTSFLAIKSPYMFLLQTIQTCLRRIHFDHGPVSACCHTLAFLSQQLLQSWTESVTPNHKAWKAGGKAPSPPLGGKNKETNGTSPARIEKVYMMHYYYFSWIFLYLTFCFFLEATVNGRPRL